MLNGPSFKDNKVILGTKYMPTRPFLGEVKSVAVWSVINEKQKREQMRGGSFALLLNGGR